MLTHLNPTAPIARDAVLTDDPKGAMDLAVALCESPRMSNLAHGLWGYHGTTSGGLELTIQALGIGGPSAFAVVSDLARLGVERVVRIGSCMSSDAALEPGSLLVAGEVEPCDGIGSSLCEGARMVPDDSLTSALLRSLDTGTGATVRSVDLYPDRAEAVAGVAALDLSSGAVAGAASARGTAWACALVVAEALGGERLGRESLEEALLGLGLRTGPALEAAAQAPGP